MAQGDFPKPVRISKGRVAWLEADLNRWKASRVSTPPQPRKAPAPKPKTVVPKPSPAKAFPRPRAPNGQNQFMTLRHRDVLARLVSDLGGNLSEAQSMLASRAATLSVWCERAEISMTSSRPVNFAEYMSVVEQLRLVLVDLGLGRSAKVAHQSPESASKDQTP
jgi:hypothetical protein